MRELTFVDTCKLEWRDVAAPRLEDDGQALVRPMAVATCDLEPLMLRRQTPFAPPFPFGHECVAEVVEVGDEVRQVQPGDLVAVPFQISCGECAACLEQRTANCRRVPPLSTYGFGPVGGEWGGALSDLLLVPFADHMLVRVPGGVSPAQVASVGDNLADAWRTVAPQLERRPGAEVLIVGGGGGGSIALYAVAVAVSLGSRRVEYIDTDTNRLERAQRLGACCTEGPQSRRVGPYPITVDASGSAAGLACALRSVDWDGECTSVGVFFEDTPLPLFEMYTRVTTFHTGRCHARPAMPPLLELVASNRLSPELVTHAVVDWEDAAEALSVHDQKHVVVR